ncbi:MAG: complex I NDUFA9 subunit family protein [Anaplasma sp.]
MKKVVVFGGSGFVGGYVVDQLVKRGHSISVFTRNQEKAARLKMLGNLGQVQIVSGDLSNTLLIEQLVTECDVVINLIGSMAPGRRMLRYLHVTVPGYMAKLAAQYGKKFIHFSAMGSEIAASSVYATSKLEGENTVVSVCKDAVIIKPNVMFGADDHFFSKLAKLAKVLPVLPLIEGRGLLQPVYVDEVAELVANVVDEGTASERIYEVCGPKTYSLKDMAQFIMRITSRKRPILELPSLLARIIAFFFELQFVSFMLKPLTGKAEPLFTADQLELAKYDIVARGPGGNVKVMKQSLEDIMPNCLAMYKKHGDSCV